jgi:hypothetical protein
MNSVLFNQAGLNAPVTGAVFGLSREPGEYHAPCQVTITGTANVVVEGHISPDDEWVVLDTFTASRMVFLGLAPRVRVRVVSATAATVRAVIAARSTLIP